MEYEHITHSFEPVYDENSRILILGTLPSTSPANAAWTFEKLCAAWGDIIKV